MKNKNDYTVIVEMVNGKLAMMMNLSDSDLEENFKKLEETIKYEREMFAIFNVDGYVYFKLKDLNRIQFINSDFRIIKEFENKV